jgi:hypothetical protein
VVVTADRECYTVRIHRVDDIRRVSVVIGQVSALRWHQADVLKGHDRAIVVHTGLAKARDVGSAAGRIVAGSLRIDERQEAHPGEIDDLGRTIENLVECSDIPVVVPRYDDVRSSKPVQYFSEVAEALGSHRRRSVINEVTQDESDVRFDQVVKAVDGTA